MADLLQFPGQQSRSAAVYQMHLFASGGSVRTTLLIRADAAARQKARGVTDGARAEFWSNRRFLDQFVRADHAVAVSIRLLDGPVPPTSASGPCASHVRTLQE